MTIDQLNTGLDTGRRGVIGVVTLDPVAFYALGY